MADGAGGDGSAVRHRVLSAGESEAELLRRFTAHELFRDVERIALGDLLEVLLQRRFLSLLFPVVYDIGIDGLTDPAALALVREILREEYPDATGNTPSHREDLVGDLLALGATREQILAARPTAVTARVVEETLALMLDAAAADGDVPVLTILRFWGEVLVSVEYGEFWRRIGGRFGAIGVPSRFYHPHHHHDGREPLSTASEASDTHSGRLGWCLARLLGEADGAIEQFARAEQQVLATRLRFYDQFVPASA
ncbi:MAG TPA: hypothetical protein VG474_15055 [Solirubrobacteraceae bacterium]|nr:hypothetical protein [Solirubrobacteraceae bacterium]